MTVLVSLRDLRPAGARFCAAAVVVGSCAAFLAAMSSAHAEEKQADGTADAKQAKEGAAKHHRQGQRMFAMGRFHKALTSYEKAYQLSKHPDILFNMGQCYRNLGDYKTAVILFRAYLDEKPDAANREAVLQLIHRLENELQIEPQKKVKKTPDRRSLPTKKLKRSESSPFYKRWWFWAGLAAVAAGGTTAYLLIGRDDGLPGSDLGNVSF